MTEFTAFLRMVPFFAELAEPVLEQFCQHVSSIHLASGETLFLEGSTGNQAYIIKEGKIEIYKTVGDKKIHLAVRQPGEIVGELSLLRESPRSASGTALTDSEVLAIGSDQFKALLDSNPTMARTMLHTIVVRLQSTEASLRQSEKMAQLGSLTAGIAHEINNPSAAVQSGARHLKAALEHHLAATLDLHAALMNSEQMEHLQRLRPQIAERVSRSSHHDAVARMDQAAALEEWLAAQGIAEGWETAQSLADLGFDEMSLKNQAAPFPPAALPVLLKWICAEAEVQRLLEEIRQGAARITDIVKAMKSYVYLDQAPNQEIDIHEGLENTLVILRHKIKQGIEVVREYDRGIAPVSAYGSELNQVWTNVIDNAIDAMGGAGRITLRTKQEGDWVSVEIEDSGPGIPPDIIDKIFYPFFTTKPVGKGTGLGLNISHGIVQKHGGDIEVSSQPGQTRFTVRLPVVKNSQRSGEQ
jgi:signal transduction histidine kinase